MDRATILAAATECLAARSERLVAAYVFGSVARDTANDASDVDVGVVLCGGRPRSIDEYPFELQVALERRLGHPVDLVVMNGAPPDLLMRILRDGVLVLERDHAARIEFEVQARNEYFDLQPFLERYRRHVLDSL